MGLGVSCPCHNDDSNVYRDNPLQESEHEDSTVMVPGLTPAFRNSRRHSGGAVRSARSNIDDERAPGKKLTSWAAAWISGGGSGSGGNSSLETSAYSLEQGVSKDALGDSDTQVASGDDADFALQKTKRAIAFSGSSASPNYGRPPSKPSPAVMKEIEAAIMVRAKKEAQHNRIVSAFCKVMLVDGLKVLKHHYRGSKKIAHRVMRFVPEGGGIIVWDRPLREPSLASSRIPLAAIKELELELERCIVWISAGRARVGFETSLPGDANLMYQAIGILVDRNRQIGHGQDVWGVEEDKTLFTLMGRGFSDWSELAKHMPGRAPKQCRNRWYNHLNPSTSSSNWAEGNRTTTSSPVETRSTDEAIVEAVSQVEGTWAGAGQKDREEQPGGTPDVAAHPTARRAAENEVNSGEVEAQGNSDSSEGRKDAADGDHYAPGGMGQMEHLEYGMEDGLEKRGDDGVLDRAGVLVDVREGAVEKESNGHDSDVEGFPGGGSEGQVGKEFDTCLSDRVESVGDSSEGLADKPGDDGASDEVGRRRDVGKHAVETQSASSGFSIKEDVDIAREEGNNCCAGSPKHVEAGKVTAATAGQSERVADAEAPEATQIELVGQFDSSQAVFALEDGGIRLNVGPSCLGTEQLAGPVTVVVGSQHVVHCEDQGFVVAVIVDCQPSGCQFNAPLELDFRVGEPLGDVDVDGERGGKRRIDVNEEQRLRDTYKVLLREGSGDVWNFLGEEKTTVVYEDGAYFIRASIDHFSQSCLAKKIQAESSYLP